MCDLSKIDVVVLAGGLGKRLRSETGNTPKVLAQVNGVPFLDILLKNLSSQGFKKVILCTGYQSQEIESYYQNNALGLTIEFSTEEAPLGTGGAIKKARSFVRSDKFFALNGDCFCTVLFKDFLKFHNEKNAFTSMVLTEVKDKKDFGSVVIDDNNAIMSFQEKSEKAFSPYVSVGIYCFEREVFDSMPSQEAFSIEHDFFPNLINKSFFGFITDQGFLDIGTPDRYKLAQEKLVNNE
ncbi:MAG: sugar phosphate nucleotidyltransferase [Candidatus Omnitrophica bacterium]|nr:sugar phosphate nucleotidyltransferase [Candidatus Omnitrophota bacterium]